MSSRKKPSRSFSAPQILVLSSTDSDLGDPALVETLPEAGEQPVRRFFADGAFDGEPVYQTVRRYQADGETADHRRLRVRDEDAQIAEVVIGIKMLNRMIRAPKPISVRI